MDGPLKGFRCSGCGEWHDEVPLDLGFLKPQAWYWLSDEEKAAARLTEDVMEARQDGAAHFFVRGCLAIPVVDSDESFVWGVWSTLSEKNFRRYIEIGNGPGWDQEPAWFGWLNSKLPLYPDTVNLKLNVRLGEPGQRPSFELEPTDHPLSVDQRSGYTWDRIYEIIAHAMHAN